MLADYQDRGQVGIEAGQAAGRFGGPAAIGNGWYRLMTFDLAADLPRVRGRPGRATTRRPRAISPPMPSGTASPSNHTSQLDPDPAGWTTLPGES